MIKYLFGSVLVFVIAFYVVSYGINKTKMSKTVDEAMNVPFGEYNGMAIKKQGDGYTLNLDKMRLYSTRKGEGVMCSGDVKLLFNKEKEAKLVMKFRYNIGPFMAEPLRSMTPAQAASEAGKAKLVKSLQAGYAAQYGIKTIRNVEFSGFSCGYIK